MSNIVVTFLNQKRKIGVTKYVRQDPFLTNFTLHPHAKTRFSNEGGSRKGYAIFI